MNPQVLLLACSARKLDHPAQALDIYQGNIFRKGLEYAKRAGLHPMILSAKHGLINWDFLVEPYDKKMAGNYFGPWPSLAHFPTGGFYLGGALYFAHAPDYLRPLVPSGTIGFMLRDLNRLLAGETREALFK